VAAQGLLFVAWHQAAVCRYHAVPGDRAAVVGHDRTYLARAALAKILGYRAVRHDSARGDALHQG
jgi:hypothetical protein